MSSLLARTAALYERGVLSHAKGFLLLLAVLLGAAAAGIPKFKLDASPDSLTLESDRALDYFREVISRYASGDLLVVTYRPQEPLLSPPSLDRLARLRTELAQVQGVQSVLSILDVPMLYSPPLSFRALSGDLPRLQDPAVDKTLALAEFHRNPIYRDTLVGPDNRTTAVLLNLAVDQQQLVLVRERDALLIARRDGQLDPTDQARLEDVSTRYLESRDAANARDAERVAAVRAIVARYKATGGADLFVGGATMVTADMLAFIRSDLRVFGIGVLAFILATLIAIFRHPKLVLLPLGTCLATAATMLGLLGWLDWRLTVISSNFISLLLIVTLAISIHLVVRYQELCRTRPNELQRTLIMDTVRQMALPCLYTALTTIVAFASLIVSDIRPVIDFGWMMALGVSLALVLTFLLLPAALMAVGGAAKADPGPEDPRTMRFFAQIVERFPRTIPLSAAALAALSIYGITQLEVENRFIDYFKSDTEIHQGMQVIDQNLGGTMTLDLVLDAPAGWDAPPPAGPAEGDSEDDAFSDFDDFDAFDDFAEDPESATAPAEQASPGYWWNRAGLRKIEKYHDFLEAQPEIGKVNSLATGYKIARDLLGSELNDIELAFMRRNLSPDLQAVLIAPYLDESAQQVRLSTRVKESAAGLSRAELIERVTAYGSDDIGIAPQNIRATGLIVLYNNMLQSLFGSQIKTLAAVFIAIMLMFLLLFRSLLVALIALVPNLLAAGLVLGVMGLAGIVLDIMTITIAAITVGMGVDHAIHYLTRFRHEYRRSGDYRQAMRRSHQTIGRALLYTAITIIAGFSVLALSNFMPSIYFGLLTSLAMLAATLGSLTLLPRLLILLRPF
ncbi:MAG: MMPL family transporter [Cellvibrionales bacterium]|nr:MMPL family transporter [Cellvibrionales bacterium]